MTSPTHSAKVPGPAGNRFFGPMVTRSRRDPLAFMSSLARDYGDICSFRIGFDRIFFVNHPDYVRDVFANHYESFLKGRGNGRAKHFIGEGVLLSEGDTHRRQRRLDLKAFHRQRLNAYALEMSACAERYSARWRGGETLDICQEMIRLTLLIVGKTLFSADVEAKDDEIGQAMDAAS
ncbi:MAG: cytochrome P450, partial [Rubrivivax sp.]|nr:cytochrome P450 [Pyrinomonadaceae bacterium]